MNTPRTDANESITCKEGDPCIAPGFARLLETELQTMTALADTLAEALGNLRTEVANTLWTSRNGTEMIPGTAESIREEVNDNIGNAFANSLEALAAYESHKKQTP